MHDDLIKFRKICLALLADKKLRIGEIEAETKLSSTSLTKYLHGKEDEMPKLRASTLGAMQDFNKNHTIDMNYAGVSIETLSGKQAWLDDQEKKAKKDFKESTAEAALSGERVGPTNIESAISPEEQNKGKSDPRSRQQLAKIFWSLIDKASECVPNNVQIIIKIKSSKL
jgi:hypothetical protein